MDNQQSLREISNELVIQRFKNGVAFTRPNEMESSNATSLADILNMPFNVYLLDENSGVISTNENVVRTFGFDSLSEILGKSVRDVVKHDFAQQVLANDKLVRKSEKLHIVEEAGSRCDDFNVEFISFKFPWYCDHAVKGIFGYALPLDVNNTTEFTANLNRLLMTGIINLNQYPVDKFLERASLNNIYLNACERDILRWIVRGKTAKDIAKIYGLSHRTIEHKIDRLKLKTKCASRSELIELAVDSGYLIS